MSKHWILDQCYSVDLFLIYDYFQVVSNQTNTSNKTKFVQNKY